MFWNKTMQRSEQACTTMKAIAEEVLALSRARGKGHSTTTADSKEETGGEPSTTGYIMHRILEHDYPSDAHRVSEIISFIVAGHETSAFTLCFFLFEMARNPVALKTLQAELDNVITPETCPNGRPTLAQVRMWSSLHKAMKGLTVSTFPLIGIEV